MTPALPAGIGDAVTWHALSGGSICEVWRARLTSGDDVVVKRTPYPPEVEADGLRALRTAGAPVPAVLGASGDVLVLEHLHAPPPTPDDWAALGSSLAALHGTTGERFGWQRDNLIGPLPQPNPPTDDWPTFYADQRIRPHLDAPALPEPVRRRLLAALDGPLQRLLPARPPASLVHGDLWSGNVVAGRWLIDPAVAYADREYELAFAALFGGLPAAMTDAYGQAWPLPDGWERRRPALQLSHLLVHVRLFGAGYVNAVTARLDTLGW